MRCTMIEKNVIHYTSYPEREAVMITFITGTLLERHVT